MLSPLQSRGLVNEDPDPLSFSELRHGLLNNSLVRQSRVDEGDRLFERVYKHKRLSTG